MAEFRGTNAGKMKKPAVNMIFRIMFMVLPLLAACDRVVYYGLLSTYSTVVYDGNDSSSGSLPSVPVIYRPGDVVTILGNTGALTRTGYTFAGWNTQPDGSGTTYTGGSTFTIGKSAVILYALWIGTITFDANGGTGAMTGLSIASGSSSVLPANTFTRSNYHFAGWATLSTATVIEYNDQASYLMEDGDDTLYVVWSGDPYEITFNANGATSGTMTAQQIAYNSSANINPNQFTRTGCTFYSWNTAADNSGTSYNDGDLYTMSMAGVILYAIWQCEVTFHPENGDPDTTQTIISGNVVTLPADPVRTGYTFSGWWTGSGGTGTQLTASTVVDQATDVYAFWTINQYTVTFDSQGGSAVTAQTVDYNALAAEPGVPVKTDCAFQAWYREASYTTLWDFATDTVTADMTLYARWLGPPVVSTTAITGEWNYCRYLAGTTAQGRGEVSSDGGATVTERGLCWNTTGSPTTADSMIVSGSGTGTFTATMSGLSENTIYHIRAYAVNSVGTAYGNEITVNTGYAFGTDHAGGYVFYNDGSGGGYVCAKTDQSPGLPWCIGTPVLIGTSWEMGSGQLNTTKIVAQYGSGSYAAWVCDQYDDGTYYDWYLPSDTELLTVYYNLYPTGIGGFTGGSKYWSSKESSIINPTTLASYNTFDSSIGSVDNKSVSHRVRAIRAF